MEKCPYCANTARRPIGFHKSGKRNTAKCTVCDSFERQQLRAQQRALRKRESVARGEQ